MNTLRAIENIEAMVRRVANEVDATMSEIHQKTNEISLLETHAVTLLDSLLLEIGSMGDEERIRLDRELEQQSKKIGVA